DAAHARSAGGGDTPLDLELPIFTRRDRGVLAGDAGGRGSRIGDRILRRRAVRRPQEECDRERRDRQKGPDRLRVREGQASSLSRDHPRASSGLHVLSAGSAHAGVSEPSGASNGFADRPPTDGYARESLKHYLSNPCTILDHEW